MIRLFKDVWLVHESEENVDPAGSNWTLESRLIVDSSADIQSAWSELLRMKRGRIVCSDKNFAAILFVYWNHILANFNRPSVREDLWNLYLLDIYLKGFEYVHSRLLAVSVEAEFSKIMNIRIPAIMNELNLRDLGYEFLLANYLMEKKGKKALLAYVRWCCWSLLASELQLFLNEIKTDIFSGHEVIGFNQSLYDVPPQLIPQYIQANSAWSFVKESKNLRIFEYKNVEEGILALKNIFPTSKDMLVIFNNHARAHRDEQGVNSFAEPIEFIYAERYEELLLRDIEMDFRITYASEHLGRQIVTTMVSKIYRAMRNKSGMENEYLNFYRVALKDN